MRLLQRRLSAASYCITQTGTGRRNVAMGSTTSAKDPLPVRKLGQVISSSTGATSIPKCIGGYIQGQCEVVVVNCYVVWKSITWIFLFDSKLDKNQEDDEFIFLVGTIL